MDLFDSLNGFNEQLGKWLTEVNLPDTDLTKNRALQLRGQLEQAIETLLDSDLANDTAQLAKFAPDIEARTKELLDLEGRISEAQTVVNVVGTVIDLVGKLIASA